MPATDRVGNATASGALKSNSFEMQKQRVWSPPASSGDHLAQLRTARAVAIVAVKEAYQFVRRDSGSGSGSGSSGRGSGSGSGSGTGAGALVAPSWALVARDFVGVSDRCSRRNCSHICLTYDATIGELVCGCPSGMRLVGWRPSAYANRSLHENASTASRFDYLAESNQCESWTPAACPLDEFMCRSDGHCIPQHFRCDSIQHCVDGMISNN